MTPGQVVGGRYRIERALAAGAYGEVFEATRLADGAAVALKALHAALLDHDEVVRRFAREAELAARVRHPHLAPVLDHDVDEATGAPFLVQPLMRGVDLAAALAAVGRFPAERAVAVVAPVMEALCALHDAGVVHRDVTPKNVVLAEAAARGPPAAVLVDLGVAKCAQDPSGAPLTVTGELLGTPAYMAPEQVEGRRDLDARCDVWAVGAVLYELMTGANPFRGRTLGETQRLVQTHRPPPLDAAAPGAPTALAAVVARALEHDRARRWPTMRAMLDATRTALPGPAPAGPRQPRGRAAVVLGAASAVGVMLAALLASRRPRAFSVRVDVRPAHAAATWNGRPLGAGAVTGEVRADGAAHTLRFEAPGYRPHTVVFRDAPPPPVVVLAPE